MWSHRVFPRLFLVAVVLVLGLPSFCADDRDNGSGVTLSQLIDGICLGGGVEPAYLVGKAFTLLLGPAVMHSEVIEEIPFLDETRVHMSYTQIPPLDRESCRTVLGALHGQVSHSIRYSRMAELRACAKDTIGRNVSRAGSNERWAWHVLDEAVSEIALSTNYVQSLICTALGKRKIAIAFVRSLGGGLLPEEEDDDDDSRICTQEEARHGRCRVPDDQLQDLPVAMQEVMKMSMRGTCSHVSWWLCKGASSVEQRMNADTFAVPVMVAAARFMGVLREQVGWEARHIINQAYRYVLGRDADQVVELCALSEL